MKKKFGDFLFEKKHADSTESEQIFIRTLVAGLVFGGTLLYGNNKNQVLKRSLSKPKFALLGINDTHIGV